MASGFGLKLLQSFVAFLPHQLDFELWPQGLGFRLKLLQSLVALPPHQLHIVHLKNPKPT